MKGPGHPIAWSGEVAGSRTFYTAIGHRSESWSDPVYLAHVEGGLGWVTCTENILSEARGNISVTSVLATNIFERHGAEWLMVHHHASHILTGDPAAQS